MVDWSERREIKKAGRSEDTENLNVPSEMMMVKGKGTNEVHERLPLGWMPSPAYPGRLGVAGSVLITRARNIII
jgi:hypothetical protein